MGVPQYNYEVVRGSTLPFLVRYSPGGSPFSWIGSTVEISVYKADGTELIVPALRITVVEPGVLGAVPTPNLLSYLTPAETVTFVSDTGRYSYEIRLTDSAGVKSTILTGTIVPRFSPIEGV